ncbi:acyltransferase domain-containing protein [Burkholderia territorii]|uniref:acyltransferase domain-containing protein n=1 Tax=Burkholderia territorii TaxID=1503055 RepID=UPI00075B126C|nr:acyltransferase domain-containing protein [Burkholderia territorii]KVQ64349.1 acyl transferase [Burkholderia territorii]KWA42795.1 acyl transferase [Burkholderia territorii]
MERRGLNGAGADTGGVQARGCAFLFPGQGAFYAGALRQLSRDHRSARQTLDTLDAVASARLGRPLTGALWRDDAGLDVWLREAPDLLQLGIYGVSVAMFGVLHAHGVKPDVLIGHSFGEIAALVCGGMYSIEQGAHIVCDRIASLQAAAPADGMMAAISAGADATRELIDASAVAHAVRNVCIAVENHPSQTVVSGPRDALERFVAACAARGVAAQTLRSPYGFHHPDLAGAREQFAARLAAYRHGPLAIPVYSPILGRRYSGADDPGARLASHFVLPVRFADAIRAAHADGIGRYVECGALNALARIVVRIAGPGTVRTFGGPSNATEESSVVTTITRYFQEDNIMKDDIRIGNSGSGFDAFWHARGPHIVDWLKGELRHAFDMANAAPAAAAPAAASTVAAFAPQVEPIAASAPRLAAVAAPTLTAVPAPSAPHDPHTAAKPAHVPRERLFAELVDIYAEAMEYPAEVFSETIELEAELGIDSVKQTEIIQRITARYALPPLPANFRSGDFKAMGQIVDFVYENQGKALA